MDYQMKLQRMDPKRTIFFHGDTYVAPTVSNPFIRPRRNFFTYFGASAEREALQAYEL